MPEVVTIGETMVLFSPGLNLPLSYVNDFHKRIAGAESNVAIGLAGLGHSSGWISKVGADGFGKFIIREVRGHGVDVSRIAVDENAPTGIMFKEISEGRETKVFYYRKGSAASTMLPEELDRDYIAGAKILHLTGITPALSENCLDTVMEAIDIARSSGAVVSFDPNIRLKLWSREKASEVIKTILPQVDIVLPGIEEGEIIFNVKTADEVVDAFLKSGVKTVALKLGAEGCIVADSSQKHVVSPFKVKKVVDPIGAGDAFAAGFLAGYLENKPLVECGRMANAMGAFAVTAPGDIEGLPDRSELEKFMKGEGSVNR